MEAKLKSFLDKALEYSYNSTHKRVKDAISGYVADIASADGELEDLQHGVRDPRYHPHHHPDDLRATIDSGINKIEAVCEGHVIFPREEDAS